MSEYDKASFRRSATETTNISLSLPNVMIDKLKQEMEERILGSIQEVIRSILSDYVAGIWLKDLARELVNELGIKR